MFYRKLWFTKNLKSPLWMLIVEILTTWRIVKRYRVVRVYVWRAEMKIVCECYFSLLDIVVMFQWNVFRVQPEQLLVDFVRSLRDHFRTFSSMALNFHRWPWPSSLTYMGSRWTTVPNIWVKGHFVPKSSHRHTQGTIGTSQSTKVSDW